MMQIPTPMHIAHSTHSTSCGCSFHLRSTPSPATSNSALTAAQTVADACRTGASTNIIFGLALGYQSCIIPTIVLAVVIFVSFSLANMYGIACAALGMLGTLATGAPLTSQPHTVGL